MNYLNLTYEAIVADAVREMGYTPSLDGVVAEELRMTAQKMAILSPVEILGREGGVRGRLTSKINFVLLINAATASPNEVARVWRELKCDALEVVEQVREAMGVVDLQGVEVTPYTRSNASYREIAVAVEIKAVSSYTYDSEAAQIV